MDELEAEEGDEITDDGNDDAADCNGHVIVAHSRENLPYNDDIDDREAATDNDIEERAELSAPETEAISGCRNGAETCLFSRSLSAKSMPSQLSPSRFTAQFQEREMRNNHPPNKKKGKHPSPSAPASPYKTYTTPLTSSPPQSPPRSAPRKGQTQAPTAQSE